ncbi:unnamed protein product [Cladocopium goreaui]|uniref:PDZ domain-containing protein n=1 Tax=Cladocopium goreaui TaxID=2562237 RepID=A0A9P1GIJ1_9DINO|nr:unnamed protein product [Cladocopium goreaui]
MAAYRQLHTRGHVAVRQRLLHASRNNATVWYFEVHLGGSSLEQAAQQLPPGRPHLRAARQLLCQRLNVAGASLAWPRPGLLGVHLLVQEDSPETPAGSTWSHWLVRSHLRGDLADAAKALLRTAPKGFDTLEVENVTAPSPVKDFWVDASEEVLDLGLELTGASLQEASISKSVTNGFIWNHGLQARGGDLLLWIDGRPSTEMSPEELAAELPLGIVSAEWPKVLLLLALMLLSPWTKMSTWHQFFRTEDRLQLLAAQGHLMADDEMRFHLHALTLMHRDHQLRHAKSVTEAAPQVQPPPVHITRDQRIDLINERGLAMADDEVEEIIGVITDFLDFRTFAIHRIPGSVPQHEVVQRNDSSHAASSAQLPTERGESGPVLSEVPSISPVSPDENERQTRLLQAQPSDRSFLVIPPLSIVQWLDGQDDQLRTWIDQHRSLDDLYTRCWAMKTAFADALRNGMGMTFVEMSYHLESLSRDCRSPLVCLISDGNGSCLSDALHRFVSSPFQTCAGAILGDFHKDGNSVTLIIEEGVVSPMVIGGHPVHAQFLPVSFAQSCGVFTWNVLAISVARFCVSGGVSAVRQWLFERCPASVLARSRGPVGFVPQGQLQKNLCSELAKHGVPAEVLEERAKTAIKTLGSEQIIAALNHRQPWRQLKMLGNNSKFQFVLPSELMTAVESNKGRPVPQNAFGRARTKVVHAEHDCLWLEDVSDVAIGAVHLFTDGSCFAQHDVQLRFAAWAVIQASCDGVTDYTGSRILGSGPLPGLLQSSVRAEFFAIMIALQITADHDGCVFLWTDCEAVVKRLRRLISGSHVRVNSAHADLWHRIEEALDGRRHKVVITRVAAHQCPDEAPSFFAEWCFRHNGLADKQAVRANFQRGEEFWDLQRRHSQATASVEFFNRTVQRVLLRISQEVVRQEVTCLSELPGVPQEPSVPLQPWRQLPAVSIPAAATRWYGDSMVRLLASWFWHTLTDCAAPVVWVSHFQLYTDFMLSTGHPGPVHVGRWVDGKSVSWLSLRGFSFKQRARWFIKVLKETLRHLDVKLQMDYGKPWSQMILFHTGIIALPWPAARLSLVDDWRSVRPLRLGFVSGVPSGETSPSNMGIVHRDLMRPGAEGAVQSPIVRSPGSISDVNEQVDQEIQELRGRRKHLQQLQQKLLEAQAQSGALPGHATPGALRALDRAGSVPGATAAMSGPGAEPLEEAAKATAARAREEAAAEPWNLRSKEQLVVKEAAQARLEASAAQEVQQKAEPNSSSRRQNPTAAAAAAAASRTQQQQQQQQQQHQQQELERLQQEQRRKMGGQFGTIFFG